MKINWQDEKASMAFLKEVYPDLPTLVLEKSYKLWQHMSKVDKKEKRRLEAMIDAIPDKPVASDYGVEPNQEPNCNESREHVNKLSVNII